MISAGDRAGHGEQAERQQHQRQRRPASAGATTARPRRPCRPRSRARPARSACRVHSGTMTGSGCRRSAGDQQGEAAGRARSRARRPPSRGSSGGTGACVGGLGGQHGRQQPAVLRRRRALPTIAMLRAVTKRPIPTKVVAGARPRFAGTDRRPTRAAGRRRQADGHDHGRTSQQAVRDPPGRRRRVVHLRTRHGDRLPRPQRRRQVHHHAHDLRADPADRGHAPPSTACPTSGSATRAGGSGCCSTRPPSTPGGPAGRC